MNIEVHDMPYPRTVSVLLFCGAGLFKFIESISQGQLNKVSAICTITLAICGIISYGVRFTKWILRLVDAKRIKKNKSGGHL